MSARYYIEYDDRDSEEIGDIGRFDPALFANRGRSHHPRISAFPERNLLDEVERSFRPAG